MACGDPGPPIGVIGHVRGDFGGVVSDEPQAALLAGDALAAGGTAADAAVAIFFGLSVTYPAAASLGGGGLCIIHGAKTGRAEVIDFTPGRPAAAPRAGGVAMGVPGAVRGMFAIHARYGRLRWERLVLPAENLARFGFEASRALVTELAAAPDGPFGNDPVARRLFAGRKGQPLREGDHLEQLALSAVLGRIRARGAGEFYSGLLARQVIDAVARIGGNLTIEDLRAYQPRWRESVTGRLGDHDVHFAVPTGGEAVAARLWEELKEKGVYRGEPPDARALSVAQAAFRVDAQRTAAAPSGPRGGASGPAATSFVVVDREGGSVACAVTLNGHFGTGRILTGTGIVAARPPGAGAAGNASLAAMLVVNRHNPNLYFAAAASGNAAAPSALVTVALRALVDGRPLENAMAEARLHGGNANGTVLAEPGIEPVVASALQQRGMRVIEAGRLGRVNAIHCAKGMPREPGSCVYRADRRGNGFAATGLR